MTFGRIVLASDGSTTSEALAVALGFAKIASLRLDIVHGGRVDAGPVVQCVVAAGVPEGKVATVERDGNPADTVAAVAEELDAGLVVVGRGGAHPSHTVHRLSHEAPCDLLVVADSPHDPAALYRRIIVATDGSATADRAARRGYDMARTVGAPVDLVYVGHHATGELISEDTIAVYGHDVETEVHLFEGDPTSRILEAAAKLRCDLIVVGNKGLTGLRGVLLGSVPKGVLDGARTDVLVCRTVRQIESQLESGEGGVVERHGEQLAVFRDEGGQLHSFSARCTHLGCVVAWNPAELTFDCPCHGSRFAPDGGVVSGPAARPLPPA